MKVSDDYYRRRGTAMLIGSALFCVLSFFAPTWLAIPLTLVAFPATVTGFVFIGAWVTLRGEGCPKSERHNDTAERIALFKSGAEVLTNDDVAEMRERARKWRFR